MSKDDVAISREHADSLSALVLWFQQMIKDRAKPNSGLTMEYCSELLQDLGGEHGSLSEDRPSVRKHE